MTISKGKIIRYNPECLFGFIQPNDNGSNERGADVFFHLRDILVDRSNFTDKEEHSKYIASLLETPHEVEYLTRIKWRIDKKTGEERGFLCAKEVEIYLT